MQQRGRMQKLDDSGKFAMPVVGLMEVRGSDSFAGQQNQERPQTFASGGYDIVPYMFYERNLREKLTFNEVVYVAEILLYLAVYSLSLHVVAVSVYI